MILEDYAYILDYLPQGHPDRKTFKREPIAYGLGELEFKLLELSPKPGITMNIGEKVYIGKDLDDRHKIQHVKRRVNFSDLTAAAQSELPFILEEIIKMNEERFIRFFNEAQAISTRLHMLELIPGLGKKTMWHIIEERKKKPFTGFQDLLDRVNTLHQPEKLLSKRIIQEMEDTSQKYHMFIKR
jgi:putative nucleotide binding protein